MIVRFCPAYSHLMTKPEFNQYFGLRDFIHFVSYLRRRRTQMLTPQLVMEALERNFNGSDNFEKICKTFLNMVRIAFSLWECNWFIMGTLTPPHFPGQYEPGSVPWCSGGAERQFGGPSPAARPGHGPVEHT